MTAGSPVADHARLATRLRGALRGSVWTPDDAGWAARSAPWSLRPQRVLAVAEVADADDMATAVRCAADAGVPITVQPVGSGSSPALDGSILVRPTRLDHVQVDPRARTVRVGAGVTWQRVLDTVSPYGLTGLAGSSSHPSVSGFCLGGGLSWFGRAHGLACNAVRSFEVVTADSVRRHVDAEHEPDLFWALRGGGGDFALVTSMEIGLVPADPLYGGRIAWPLKQAPAVLDAFRATTAQAPEQLTTWLTLLRLPDLPIVPDFLRGAQMVTVDLTYLGSAEQARHALRPLNDLVARVPPMVDGRTVLPVAALDEICQEPRDPMPFREVALPLTEFGDAQAARLLEQEGPASSSPLLMTQLRHLGGALARPDRAGGARNHVAEPFSLMSIGIGAGPDAVAADTAHLDSVRKSMRDVLGEHSYYTLLRPEDPAAYAFPADVITRLRRIKVARDPAGVIRANHPVLTQQPIRTTT